MTIQDPKYRRILLKMSGEVLLGNTHAGIDPKVLLRIAHEIAALVNIQVQVAIVMGGGNLFRGAELSELGIDRITGDQMGMLSTVMNGLALRDALESIHVRSRIFSAFAVTGIADAFDRRKAIYNLEKNHVVVFTGGTGNPLFTTDSAASLRGIEIEAEAVLKATKVDGVYSKDPVKFPDAKRYARLTFNEVLTQDLKVMDLSAILLCRDHDMPIHVFDIKKPSALMNVVLGKEEGTIIHNDE
ncbi:MAG: uridylate kinase [uncultured bacterium]|nr:MAG: uridylate kinase [uncultured bacterium]OGT23359.1 MAG: UMP kinase [Gammaproteobacteria bacterium RIFCSPHIGHO2_12_38_15]OGT66815.1 MAG: UMP kinase [Gammaproteobacteria bacterium RIFCSPLOWO2_02_FULL_38_11]OGT75929.1 MAG: UMP kinase [Gammaproteobacteria bacterium RIFCSPLOWO2_12_FULL_38_14]